MSDTSSGYVSKIDTQSRVTVPQQSAPIANALGGMASQWHTWAVDIAKRLGYRDAPPGQYIAVGTPEFNYVAPGTGVVSVGAIAQDNTTPTTYTVFIRRGDTSQPTIPIGNGGLYKVQRNDIIVVDWDLNGTPPTMVWFPDY